VERSTVNITIREGDAIIDENGAVYIVSEFKMSDNLGRSEVVVHKLSESLTDRKVVNLDLLLSKGQLTLFKSKHLSKRSGCGKKWYPRYTDVEVGINSLKKVTLFNGEEFQVVGAGQSDDRNEFVVKGNDGVVQGMYTDDVVKFN